MSAVTSIEWCDSTFNPWIGCTKVSQGGGCDNCYAERSTPARTEVLWLNAACERALASTAGGLFGEVA